MRYVSTVNELRHPDIVFLPGSKNTMGDLLWMRQNGLEAAVKNSPVRYLFWNMRRLSDAWGFNSRPRRCRGGRIYAWHGASSYRYRSKDSKTRLQTSGEIAHVDGVLSRLSGCHFLGYEIHMGKSAYSAASDEQGACADRKMS